MLGHRPDADDNQFCFLIVQPQHITVHPGTRRGSTRLHSLDGRSPFGVVKEAEVKVELSVISKEMIADVMVSKDGGQGSSVDCK